MPQFPSTLVREVLNLKDARIETLEKELAEEKQAHGILQRTVKHMEEAYLSEHASWGTCTNLRRAEDAEKELRVMRRALEMTLQDIFDYPDKDWLNPYVAEKIEAARKETGNV